MEIIASPHVPPRAAAEVFVAAVMSWVCLSLHGALRDPKTPPAQGVLLDFSLGLAAVMAAVFFFAASLKVFF